jgi:predicted transcriptional regulator
MSSLYDAPYQADRARPSTLLRARRLRALIDALALSHMDVEAIAELLGCSGSAVRNYLLELTDARVVHGPERTPSRAGERGKLYRLSQDAGLVEQYLARLSVHHPSRALASLREEAGKCRSLADARYFHFNFLDRSLNDCGRPEARRDPLVAALFGKPEASFTGNALAGEGER